ncbi:MAG: diacylglycerol kinase family protein [Rhizomicrobium sp.]|nr:diacylglycerol kinase family protein [Rhizomicrobium sp.]
MCAFVIVDPVSCGSQHSRGWRLLEPKLAEIYPYMSLAFPRRRSEMAALVSAALREGHTEIVAVGGDLLEEAVNGFFDGDGSLSPDAVLAFLATSDGVSKLSKAAVHPIDVGRATYLSRDGKPRTRYFATMAAFGHAAGVGDTQKRSLLEKLGDWRSLGYRGRAVRLIVDQSFDEIVTIRSVAIGNRQIIGKTSGVQPETDDGQFNVAITMQTRAGNALREVKGRRVLAAPVAETHGRAVPVALDYHSVGRLPATFEILPRALNVRC